MQNYIDPIVFCNLNAQSLIEQYESRSFEQVHGDLVSMFSSHSGAVLDIGAGTGRDAEWIASRGFSVLAVEPSVELRKAGAELHSHEGITWVDDRLPGLKKVVAGGERYDVILMSAVMMFLSPKDRNTAIGQVVDLLRPSGLVVMTVRLGEAEPERGLYKIERKDINEMIKASGLVVKQESYSKDQLGRDDVRWVSLILSFD